MPKKRKIQSPSLQITVWLFSYRSDSTSNPTSSEVICIFHYRLWSLLGSIIWGNINNWSHLHGSYRTLNYTYPISRSKSLCCWFLPWLCSVSGLCSLVATRQPSLLSCITPGTAVILTSRESLGIQIQDGARTDTRNSTSYNIYLYENLCM